MRRAVFFWSQYHLLPGWDAARRTRDFLVPKYHLLPGWDAARRTRDFLVPKYHLPLWMFFA